MKRHITLLFAACAMIVLAGQPLLAGQDQPPPGSERAAAAQPAPAAPPAAAPAVPAPAVPPPPPPRASSRLAPLAVPAQPPPTQTPRPAPGAEANTGINRWFTPTTSFNVKIDVQVTDKLETKVLSQETFSALVQPATTAKMSRMAAANPAPLSGALEVRAESIKGEVIVVTVGAEFNLGPRAAGEKDQGVRIGQSVTSAMVFGKATTVIDISSDAQGRRRFVVQVTATKVPIELQK